MMGTLEQGGPMGSHPGLMTELRAGDLHMGAEPPWSLAALSVSTSVLAVSFLQPIHKAECLPNTPGDSSAPSV